MHDITLTYPDGVSPQRCRTGALGNRGLRRSAETTQSGCVSGDDAKYYLYAGLKISTHLKRSMSANTQSTKIGVCEIECL